jgi:MFS family permease
MLNGIGITDTDMKLILNIVYAVVGWVASVIGSRLHDVVGRRKMLIRTTAGMTVCLAIVAACAAGYTKYGNTAASSVSIVFIFMFGAIFACGFTPMQPIYPAEVVSNKMRAKAMGTFKLTAGAAGFLNTFVGPIALSNVSLRGPTPHLSLFITISLTYLPPDWVLVLRVFRVLGHVRNGLYVSFLR